MVNLSKCSEEEGNRKEKRVWFESFLIPKFIQSIQVHNVVPTQFRYNTFPRSISDSFLFPYINPVYFRYFCFYMYCHPIHFWWKRVAAKVIYFTSKSEEVAQFSRDSCMKALERSQFTTQSTSVSIQSLFNQPECAITGTVPWVFHTHAKFVPWRENRCAGASNHDVISTQQSEFRFQTKKKKF